jgi:hypothetical protein
MQGYNTGQLAACDTFSAADVDNPAGASGSAEPESQAPLPASPTEGRGGSTDDGGWGF